MHSLKVYSAFFIVIFTITIPSLGHAAAGETLDFSGEFLRISGKHKDPLIALFLDLKAEEKTKMTNEEGPFPRYTLPGLHERLEEEGIDFTPIEGAEYAPDLRIEDYVPENYWGGVEESYMGRIGTLEIGTCIAILGYNSKTRRRIALHYNAMREMEWYLPALNYLMEKSSKEHIVLYMETGSVTDTSLQLFRTFKEMELKAEYHSGPNILGRYISPGRIHTADDSIEIDGLAARGCFIDATGVIHSFSSKYSPLDKLNTWECSDFPAPAVLKLRNADSISHNPDNWFSLDPTI
jgi:hypothetical protein